MTSGPEGSIPALAPGLGSLASCAVVHAACFPEEPWSADSLADLASLPGTLAWHLAADGRHLGFLLARQAGAESEVLTLAVAAAFRRRGLAKTMMTLLIGTLRQEGVLRLFLEVGAENLAARALYSSLGFSQVGRRKEYYRDGTDAVVLRLEIDHFGETAG